MDVQASHPLAILPREQCSLVPVSTALVSDTLDAEADDFAWLWQCFCKLARLFVVTLLALRRLRLQVIELRLQAHSWRAYHERAVRRAAALAAEVQRLQAEMRELKRRFYGRQSETSSTTKPKLPANNHQISDRPKRARGQQRGSQGHGRREHQQLPTTTEPCVLPKDQQRCAVCNEPFTEIPGSADGDILEIDVRAHRRRYQRQRYRRRCTCPSQPAVVTAPPPPKLIPKSPIGISLWVLILLRKFQFFQPLYRVLAELRGYALQLPAGTITGGLRKLEPLFQPLYEGLVEHNRQAGHWHCDETRWLVFAKQADKAGFAWNLWVFAAKHSIVFVLDPSRSHTVPEGYFGADAAGIINVDRYGAYKAMAQVKKGQILLAFCWAHVRRDFLAVLTGWPALTDWAWSWVEDIAALYQCNDQRLSLLSDAPAYAAAEQGLRAQVEHMRQRCDSELSQPALHPAQRKALTSLRQHWTGLTVFVDQPHVPMDNNEAERRERGPVVARKNFYGSGALWSGRLAAMLFSLFQTLQVWGLDTAKWLTAYLSACARAGGKPPPDPQNYLPWNMTTDQRQSLSVTTSKPPPHPSPPTTLT
jgi:transposase